jgi:ABC-type multidrug transport system fused ATPase/permease subunit
MKSTTSALSAPFVLKVVGYIMILSSMIDFATLLLPMKWQDEQWLGSTLIQTVDRGVIPLIGLVFVYVSSYLSNGSFKPEGRNPFMTGRFVVMVLSGILGLTFLLAVPIHFTNTNKVANTAIDNIGKKTKQDEDQVNAQVQQRLVQLQEQVKDKAKLEAELKQINEVVNSGQVNGQKLEAAQIEQLKKSQKDLQKLKDDPSYLQTMAKEASDQELQKIRERKQKIEEQARAEAIKTSVRTGLGSFLLATAFSIISWLGLTEMGLFGKR